MPSLWLGQSAAPKRRRNPCLIDLPCLLVSGGRGGRRAPGPAGLGLLAAGRLAAGRSRQAHPVQGRPPARARARATAVSAPGVGQWDYRELTLIIVINLNYRD